MNATLQIFEFQSHQVRTVVAEDGAPWWVAADVCGVLGIRNNRQAVAKLDEDEKGVCQADTLGGKQAMTTINESGLYALIVRSDKPEAKAFRKWVTSEVLPAIRKTGGYQVATSPAAPAIPVDYKGALRALLATIEEKEQLEAQRAKEKPMVDFYHQVAASPDTVSMAEAAKLIGYGRNGLMKQLREDGIFDRKNVPKQEYIDRKLFRVVESTWKDSAGKTHVVLAARAYQRGVEFLRRKYGQMNPIWLPASPAIAHLFTEQPLDMVVPK